ncbi:hypothetical protein FQA47_006208 [Oryzias melastigma]|uniref:Uncharacterized protein n=1 Tax=Oryzias melastigma TaxID=30732 RepID=A0A834C968_ORYME|nr:hypothetical protein FQA47_006208 [Oryzias melastigma]
MASGRGHPQYDQNQSRTQDPFLITPKALAFVTPSSSVPLADKRGLDPSMRRPLGHREVARRQWLPLSAPTPLHVVQNNCPHVSS